MPKQRFARHGSSSPMDGRAPTLVSAGCPGEGVSPYATTGTGEDRAGNTFANGLVGYLEQTKLKI